MALLLILSHHTYLWVVGLRLLTWPVGHKKVTECQYLGII